MGNQIVNSELWMEKAACKDDEFADLFFHPEGERGVEKELRDRKAKKVCKSCSVISNCLDFVVKHKEPYGVWGGLSEDDRRHAGISLSVTP